MLNRFIVDGYGDGVFLDGADDYCLEDSKDDSLRFRVGYGSGTSFGDGYGGDSYLSLEDGGGYGVGRGDISDF